MDRGRTVPFKERRLTAYTIWFSMSPRKVSYLLSRCFSLCLWGRKLNTFLEKVKIHFFHFADIHTSWETLRPSLNSRDGSRVKIVTNQNRIFKLVTENEKLTIMYLTQKEKAGFECQGQKCTFSETRKTIYFKSSNSHALEFQRKPGIGTYYFLHCTESTINRQILK